MDEAGFDEHLKTLTFADTVDEDWATGDTIVPLDQESSFDAKRTLPQVSFSDANVSDFRIVSTLGEGGMGVVQLAEQSALRRLVAVKTAKNDDSSARRRMLEEAQILGKLEHPNVVPVYVLGENKSDGSPIIAMKRVEGLEWSEILGHGEEDLEWHLRILIQVCNALRFAHAQGVIHRDLKPENVMIGDYGEVYLLDWGVALSLTGDLGLPSPATSKGLGGTPAYMAPEMAEARNDKIDVRTDVYLLGAVLHELLTGTLPHDGDTLLSVCFAAFQSEPKVYGPDVNPELARIAQRAMKKERGDRFQTVADFAQAIEDALEHEASVDLTKTAQSILADMEDADAQEQVRILIEAEFGYRQALRIWPQNPDAQTGIQSCLRARVQRSLRAEDIVGARVAFEQMTVRDEELAAQIEVLADKIENRDARVGYLEEIEKKHDLKTGTRSRQRFAILTGLLFVGLSLYTSFRSRTLGAPDMGDLMITFPRVVLFGGVGILIYRKKLFANVANRRLTFIILSLFITMFFVRYTHYLADGSALFALISENVLVSFATIAIGVASGSIAIALAGLAYIAPAIVGAVTREVWLMILVLGLSHTIYFSTMAWVWRPSKT